MGTTTRGNRLARETSPYLLQHAHNPVDWYPWGDEAFAAARRERKPILLSVGYSACHWCHVMERESFENEAIAEQMNRDFVNVKVDREERPDVDEIYMSAVQLLTGRGGWPMTMFLTPDGEPFYGGTYYPPQDRHGLPGFPRVLTAVTEAWRDRPQDVASTVVKLRDGLERLDRAQPSANGLDGDLVVRAADSLAGAYDARFGGLGRAPKFPNSRVLGLFLRAWDVTGRRPFLEMTTHTLRQMAAGGIYDHLGGGFHRYSVDERWLVPHFEKMLYDEAELVRVYLDAYRASGDAFFRDVALDVLAYARREMLAPEGGFYSTQDADSEGVEGKFFVWSKAEVESLLGESAEIFCRVYDVTDEGNFEHANILHRTLTDEQAAKMFGRQPAEVTKLLAGARRTLFEARERRIKPARDEKILVAWNGLLLSGLADAYGLTGDPALLEAAERTLAFLDAKLWKDGRLLHVYKDGEARISGFLDDVAALGLGSLDLYEATSDAKHLERALRLGRDAIDRFWDAEKGGFFYTPADHEKLILRTKPVFDGSVPSGNSLAADLCLRLHHWTGDEDFLHKAERVLELHRDSAEENPFGHAYLLSVLDLWARGPKEVVVVAPGGAGAAAALLEPVRRAFVPNRFVFVYDPAKPPAEIPFFAREKPAKDGRPTAYVCRGFTCSAPVTSWTELAATLEVRA
jgi:uncharacterized protein